MEKHSEDMQFLNYMLEHNTHHLEEMEEVVDGLKGKEPVSRIELLEKSIALLRQSNEALAQAIEEKQG